MHYNQQYGKNYLINCRFYKSMVLLSHAGGEKNIPLIIHIFDAAVIVAGMIQSFP